MHPLLGMGQSTSSTFLPTGVWSLSALQKTPKRTDHYDEWNFQVFVPLLPCLGSLFLSTYDLAQRLYNIVLYCGAQHLFRVQSAVAFLRPTMRGTLLSRSVHCRNTDISLLSHVAGLHV